MTRPAAVGWVLASSFVIVASGCAPAAVARARHRIDGDSSQSLVELAVGETHEIELTAPGGTGYEWTVASANPVVKVGPGRSAAIDIGRVGGPMAWRFEVTGVHEGPGRVSFSLVRPWETGVAPVETATISVRVDPQ